MNQALSFKPNIIHLDIFREVEYYVRSTPSHNSEFTNDLKINLRIHMVDKKIKYCSPRETSWQIDRHISASV